VAENTPSLETQEERIVADLCLVFQVREDGRWQKTLPYSKHEREG